MNRLLYIYLVKLQSKGLLVNLVMNEEALNIFKQAITDYNNNNFKQAVYLLNSLRASNLDKDLKEQIAELELEVANKLQETKYF